MKLKEIITQLENIFAGPAWHGPSLLEVLDKIEQNHAFNSHKSSHSIIEIIGHMVTWRNFVTEKLKGNDTFDVSEEMNFPKSTDLTLAISSLKASQQSLIQAISSFPEERLKEK